MNSAPQVLVISNEQWPRALLRAELEQAGYDAVGAETVSEAMHQSIADPERPVQLVVVDSGIASAEAEAMAQLRRRYPGVPFVVIQRAGPAPPGPWTASLHRPVTIGDIVAAVRKLI